MYESQQLSHAIVIDQENKNNKFTVGLLVDTSFLPKWIFFSKKKKKLIQLLQVDIWFFLYHTFNISAILKLKNLYQEVIQSLPICCELCINLLIAAVLIRDFLFN